jgi:hypothetical protein
MLSQNVAKGIQQLLGNASRLLDAYARTKDESLVPIIKGLLEAATVELDDVAQSQPVVVPHIIPDIRPSMPDPRISPTITMYGAFMDGWTWTSTSSRDIVLESADTCTNMVVTSKENSPK